MVPSPLPALLAKASAPGVISFAIGMPATELFPWREIREIGDGVLASGGSALQYSLPSKPLRHQIATLMARRDVDCVGEQVFLCTGAQQGLTLLAQLLLDPGGQVVVESSVYDGLRVAINPYYPDTRTVPSDRQSGMDVEALEAHLRAGVRPAFVYVMPDGHNPLGCSLSLEKRHFLVEIARRWEVPIIEDDACGLLTYDEPRLPPLRSLDERWVLYVGTFSKILAPALRTGWLVVPEALIPRLSMLKQAKDFDCASFAHHLIADFLASGRMDAHLEELRREYRRRRDAALGALEKHLGSGGRWTHPRAGLYVWVELPGVDTTRLLESAIEHEKVAFSPGRGYAGGEGEEAHHALRLSFGNLSPAKIEEGIARLSGAVSRYRGRRTDVAL